MRLTRRRFGQGMATTLVLTTAPVRAHNGPHEVKVEIKNFVFAPSHVDIRAGDSVIWVNTDIAPHTATHVDGAWDTETLEKDETGMITFNESGEYLYFCAYHTHMTGLVRVSPKNGG